MKKKRLTNFSYLFKNNVFYILLSLVFGIIYVGCSLYITLLIGNSIDFMIGKSNVDFESINKIIFIIISLVIISVIFQTGFDGLLNMISANIVKNLRSKTFKKLNYLPISYIDHNLHGDLVSRVIDDVDNVGVATLSSFKSLYRGVITILFTIGFMFYSNYILALVVVVLTPATIIVSSIISSKCNKYFKERAKNNGEVLSLAFEDINNYETINLNNLSNDKLDDFKKVNKKAKGNNFKASLASSWINPSTRLINNIIYAAVLLVGAFLILKDTSNIKAGLTIGSLSAFLSFANSYMKPFNEITSVMPEIKSGIVSFKRQVEIYELEDEKDEGKEILDKINDIVFEDVSFGYKKDKTIIKDLDLEINSNIRAAIVGPTGCGKSTIINLLLRFYPIDNGKILINGKDINEYELSSYRSKFGLVLQDYWLFSGTIFENIAYSKTSASKEEVITAAKLANADGFISRLPQGYETRITSSSLSKGEAQLVSLARLLLADPDFVILDEATSNIDARTEVKINRALRTLMENKISIIIAHRLGTIKNSDLILTLKDGSIIEKGTHEDLINLDGFYAKLYNSQFKWNFLTGWNLISGTIVSLSGPK